MSFKDLNIHFKSDSKGDIAKIYKTAFTNQQIKIICLGEKSPINQLKFNKNTMKEYVILADLVSLVKSQATGIEKIKFELDKTKTFNKKSVSVIATYNVSYDKKTPISSSYKLFVNYG